MARSYNAGEGSRALGGLKNATDFGLTSIPRNFVRESAGNPRANERQMAQEAVDNVFNTINGMADMTARAFGAPAKDSMKWTGSKEKAAMIDVVGLKIGDVASKVSRNMRNAKFPEESFSNDPPSEMTNILKEAYNKITAVYNPASYGMDVNKQDTVSRQRGNLQVGSDLYSVAMTVYAGIMGNALGDGSKDNVPTQRLAEKISQEIRAYGSNNRESAVLIGEMIGKVAELAYIDLNKAIGEAKAKLK